MKRPRSTPFATGILPYPLSLAPKTRCPGKKTPAGGGTKGGISHGQTDELGFSVAEDPVHVHDLQATLLHLLGFDHEKLIYRFQGRDFRLTDVQGRVVSAQLA